MDISPRGLLTSWIPTVPSLLKTAILSAVGKSENAKEQDWLIEILVNAARPILQTPTPLLKSQEYFKVDPGVFGQAWIATYTVPAPNVVAYEDNDDALNLVEAVQFATRQLARFDEEYPSTIQPFDSAGIEVEWTSHRRKARPWTRPPSRATQRQIYDAASLEIPDGEHSPVILYAHGGAFCLMDPANHRFNAVDLATSTKSRLLSVRYRLSPQAIFPSALLDMFLCYLALLDPPPNAFHKAVPADKIILAGDSSGGNLVTALQVLLIRLNNTSIKNPWKAGTIRIPSQPTAALSLSSPWLDITRSLPSQIYNSRWDFIAPASKLSADLMSTSPLFPADEIWPAEPARTETYCDAVMCAHPLVSPLMTPKEVLKHFPSTYICTGWEGMTDESQVFARRLQEAKQDVSAVTRSVAKDSLDSGYASISNSPHFGPVRELDVNAHRSELMFEGYTGMPHVFSIIPHRTSTAAKKNRAEHMVRAAMGQVGTSSATWTNGKTMKIENIGFSQLGSQQDKLSGYSRAKSLSDEMVFELVDEGRQFRVRLEKKLRDQESSTLTHSKATPQISNSGLMILWQIVFNIRDLCFYIFYWLTWKKMQY